ncbi:MAG: indolepyruvate oxidoreductase subunit beta [Oscillospiraceae bacterium]|jgi:indolepyruvate ferredoxin oxidoreductase beta subunit|nr:indolepyruvate oxidoreductase subunit beta [Oscillospiraceae bacterium]
MNNTSIMIVGVGGQGTLLASRLLGAALLSQGYDVKVSEVHGMSQRGGSVVTYVKYGQAVASPIIDRGEADIILAFEQLEAARWLPYLKPGGKLIANTQTIDPMPVITGAAAYPDGIFPALRAAGADLRELDALSLALQAGSARAVNVVLLGALARQLEIPRGVWETAVQTTVKPQFAEMNLRAFARGYEA